MFSEASLISPRNQFLSEWWVCRYCSKFALNVATKERFQASPLATFIQCFGQRCAVTRDSGDSGRSKGSARPSSTSCVVFRVRLRNWVARGLERAANSWLWAFGHLFGPLAGFLRLSVQPCQISRYLLGRNTWEWYQLPHARGVDELLHVKRTLKLRCNLQAWFWSKRVQVTYFHIFST